MEQSSKEAINTLTNKLEKVVDENKQLQIDKALQIQMNKRLIEEGIPKSVIQNKIDKFNKAITNAKEGEYDFIGYCRIKKQVLQELLEERK